MTTGSKSFLPVIALLFVVSCSALGKDEPEAPPPDTRPIVDTAPYWCEFVSRESFRRVTGLGKAYTEDKDSPWKTSGGCLLDAGKDPPLGIQWSAEGDNVKVLRTAHENWDDNNPIPIPKELGKGFAAIADNDMLGGHPYYVISSFTCDDKDTWVRISLRRIQKGRDATQDLIDLMRVAQTRYGELKECTPKPSNQENK